MEVLERPEGDLRYGWGKFRPRFLQVLINAKFFLFFLIVFVLAEGMIVSGITLINLQVLEKRFQLTSKEAGFIAASNDISAIVLTSFVSFYGAYANKPKWLGFGSLLTGIGALLFALPHLMIERYEPRAGVALNSTGICSSNNTAQGGAITCSSGYSQEWYYLFIFSLAQMLMGAGTTPLYALGPAYVDENVLPKSSPVYLGLFFAAALAGPGLGFVIGGHILEIWVDNKMPEGLHITVEDPRWVGAWWLGYLICGMVMIFSSIFLSGFPRELPGSRKMREKAINERNLPKADENIKGKIKDIIPATVSLLKNPTYMFNTLAATGGALVGSGIVAFIPKFALLKYGVSSTQLSASFGIIFMLTGVFGTVIGSLVVRHFNLKKSCKKSAKYSFIFIVLSCCGAFSWLVPGCSDVSLAGIVKPYHNSSLDRPSLVTSCNAGCACSEAGINPVCGDDNLVYFSPCHAGCKDKTAQNSFTNCSCILSPTNTTGSIAEQGYCDRGSGCKKFSYFLVLAFMVLFTIFLSAIPSKVVVLRSVPDNQRAYALGLQFVLVRSLGFIPGPLLFGVVFDSLCTLWGRSCGRRGSCQLYDVQKLSFSISAIEGTVKVAVCIFLFISYWYCKPSYEDPSGEPADAQEMIVLAEHDDYPETAL